MQSCSFKLQFTTLEDLYANKLRLCKHLAEENTQMRPRFEQQREQLRVHVDQLQHTEIELKKMKKAVDAMGESRSLDKIVTQLATSMRKAETESEVSIKKAGVFQPYNDCLIQTIANQLETGELTFDSFRDRFTAQRRLYHMRKVKLEKLRELLGYQQYRYN